MARALWEQVQGDASATCKRRSLVDPAWQRVLLARRLPQSETTVPGLCDTLSWLRSKSGACRRKGKLLLQGRKQLSRVEDRQSREAIDKQHLLHWRRELAELVSEGGLPIAAQAQLASAPEEIIVASLGSMRASTIRKKVREWRKLRNFCLGACRCPWPSHVGVVLDYLRERVDEPCGRTVPEAVVSAFAFMEKVGCVPAPERVSTSQILRNFVNQATHDLEVGAPPTKKAPLLPLVMVGSLELMVVDAQAPLYARGLAFCKLLKLWTACRTSDLCGLNPSSPRLNRLGLVGVLEKTKTTGAGKRIRHLPIYICHSAYFMAPDWLTVGLKVWSDPEMSFGRDYFLPLPKPDWTGVCKRMAEYADSAGLSVQLLRRLYVPRRQGSKWLQS